MKLDELIPERVEWRPTAGTTELELYFRKYSLEDEAWLKREFGDKLEAVFAEVQSASICRIAYHQLDPVSKRELMNVKFMDVDEMGKDFEVALKGPEKIGMMIIGAEAMMDLINNILKTRGLSIPLLEKIVEKVGLDGLRNLAHERNQTGSRSST